MESRAREPGRLAPGTQLGSYAIVSLLGAGGMGEVYLATDSRLRREVALKVLPAEVAADPDRRRRFEREAQAAARLSHPHIVTLYSIEEHDGMLFLTMERVDGKRLATPGAGRPMPVAQVLDIGTQLADAVAAAHEHGVVHRDLKPANVLVDRSGRVKVLDFGLARLREERAGSPAETMTRSNGTAAGEVLGTVGYMAPEQAEGQMVDHRADIFALGVILYELSTGRRPFEGDTAASFVSSLLRDTPALATDLNPKLPTELARILRRCLAKEPDRRYQTAVDLRNDLEDLKHESDAKAAAPQAYTPTPRRRASRRVLGVRLAAGLAAIAMVTVVALLLLVHRAPALTEKDTILLADIENTTGDQVFDGTLKQALAVTLGQSPYLNILPDSEVQTTLRYMERPADQRITRDVAREICERRGVKAMLVGSISSLGSLYVVTLEAINARSGEALSRQQVQAARKEDVLTALGGAASKLRAELGESLATIQKFDTPLNQATTSSLEALRAYTQGREEALAGRFAASIPLMERAIEIDPNFAVAYNGLSVAHLGVAGHEQDVVRWGAKAFELRDRVTEKERLQITAVYHLNVTGDLDRANETNELFIRTYPREPSPRNNVAWGYLRVGAYDKAVAQANEGLRLNPGIAVLYSNLGWALRAQGRYDEAKTVFAQAAARKLEYVVMHVNLYLIAFAEQDQPGVLRQVQSAAGGRDESWLVDNQAAGERFAGRFRQAAGTTRRAIAAAERYDLRENVARIRGGSAIADAVVGNCASAKQASTAVGGTSATVGGSGRSDAQSLAALALALCGEATRAEAIATDLATREPASTDVAALEVPTIRAGAQLSRGNAAGAVQLLEKTRSYELGQDWPFWPQYVRGLAYMKQGAPADAMREFQAIIDHRSIWPNHITYPLAYLGLARTAAQAGDTARSRKAYQDFFALWKDADPDIPILQDARREYR